MDTSGPGSSNPIDTNQEDKFKDLMALVIEPNARVTALYQNVILKSDQSDDDNNPTIAKMIGVKLRLVQLKVFSYIQRIISLTYK